MMFDQESITLIRPSQPATRSFGHHEQPSEDSPSDRSYTNGGLPPDVDRRADGTAEQAGTTAGGAQGTPGKAFSLRALPNRKKGVLLLLCFANMSANTCFALLGPFFPAEAEIKGMSPAVTGLVFSCFELCVFISSPFFGSYMSVLGPRFVFIAGQFLAGGCSILFGFLDLSPPGAPFTALSFVLRIVKALGASGFVTASFTLIGIEFPDNVSIVFGTLEVFAGLGYVIGPVIGGSLYEVGGFGLPFFLMGSALMLCCCLTFLLLPAREGVAEQPRKKRSLLCLLKSPLILTSAFTVVLGSYSLGFFDASLAIHLEQFHLSAFIVGLFISIVAVIYSLTAPLLGWLSDRFPNMTFRYLIIGNIIMSVSLMLLGPSPLLPFLKTEIWLVAVSLVILGPGFSLTIVPSFKCFYLGARRMGFEDGTELDGLVSGLLTASIHLGGFLGPTIGNSVLEASGYEWSVTLNAAFCLFAAFCLSSYLLAEKLCLKPKDFEDIGRTDTESTYLSHSFNKTKSEASLSMPVPKHAGERETGWNEVNGQREVTLLHNGT